MYSVQCTCIYWSEYSPGKWYVQCTLYYVRVYLLVWILTRKMLYTVYTVQSTCIYWSEYSPGKWYVQCTMYTCIYWSEYSLGKCYVQCILVWIHVMINVYQYDVYSCSLLVVLPRWTKTRYIMSYVI